MSLIRKYLGKRPHQITGSDIESFIQRRIEESSDIEYKHIKAHENIHELAKHVCGFANSDGGLIFLGIAEGEESRGNTSKIYPEAITWGCSSLERETLEDRLFSQIKPRLEFRIHPVRKENSSDVIYIIEVPDGKNKPYWCQMGFYKRRNFKSQPMDYDEIKNMFSVRQINREKIIDNLLGPIKNQLIITMKNIDVNYTINVEEIEKIVQNYGYLYHQLEFPLIDSMDDFIGESKRRNSFLGDFRRTANNIIKKYFSPVRVEGSKKEIDVDAVMVFADCLFINGEVLRRDADLQYCLLKGINPKEYFKRYRKIQKIQKYNYKIQTIPFTKEIPEEEFHQKWEKCLKEADKNDLFKYLRLSKDETINRCEGLWDLIDEYL